MKYNKQIGMLINISIFSSLILVKQILSVAVWAIISKFLSIILLNSAIEYISNTKFTSNIKDFSNY